MRDWDISGAGDRWSVRLDVRDFGGALGFNLSWYGWYLCCWKSSGLGRLEKLLVHYPSVLGVLWVCYALSAFLLHCMHISRANLNPLRTAFVAACWSTRMPLLAHPGAVLSLLDGPDGCDPAYFVGWTQFQLMRGYLAYCSCLQDAGFHFSRGAGTWSYSPVLLRLGLSGTRRSVAGPRLVWVLCIFWLSLGRCMKTPFLILRAWQKSVFANLCKRVALGEVVGGFSLYDREGSSKLLLSSDDRKKRQGTFKGHFCWECLESVSFWSECVESLYLVAVGQMVMVISSGIALSPPHPHPSGSSQGES